MEVVNPERIIFIISGSTLEKIICEYLEYVHGQERQLCIGDLQTQIDFNPRLSPSIFFNDRLGDVSQKGLNNTIKVLRKISNSRKVEKDALKRK